MSDADYQRLYAQTTREREREYADEAEAEHYAAYGEPPTDADLGAECAEVAFVQPQAIDAYDRAQVRERAKRSAWGGR